MAALYSSEEALSRLNAATLEMPPQAQREVRELYQQFAQYNQALTAAFPSSSHEEVTLEEARRQLQTLRDLRAQYFGTAKAQTMFGLEESMQQQLLEDAANAVATPNISQSKAIEHAQEKLAREMLGGVGGSSQGP